MSSQNDPSSPPIMVNVMTGPDDGPADVMAALTHCLVQVAQAIGADPVAVLEAATNAARAMRDGTPPPGSVVVEGVSFPSPGGVS